MTAINTAPTAFLLAVSDFVVLHYGRRIHAPAIAQQYVERFGTRFYSSLADILIQEALEAEKAERKSWFDECDIDLDYAALEREEQEELGQQMADAIDFRYHDMAERWRG